MEERLEKIIKLLRMNHYMTVQALCEALAASPATVRRALVRLDDLGQLQYVNGGALLLKPETAANQEMHKQKQRIAQAALAHIQPGDTLFLDAGSTNNILADCLISFSNLQVVTNSIYIAYRLYSAHDAIRVYVCGGSIGGPPDRLGSVAGDLAESLVRNVRANTFFMGCSAVSVSQGITDPNLPVARLKQCMMQNAQRTILLCDHTKLNGVHVAFVAPVSAVERMITDAQADKDALNQLRQAGIPVEAV